MTAGAVELLLVEDDPGDAELILLSLGQKNVERTLHLHDGAEALDYLLGKGAHKSPSLESLPKVVLLDLKLPRVDGFGVLRELRRTPRTRVLPVVMLTSSRIERDIAQAYRLGANSFVQKPVDFETFRNTVCDLASYWLDLNEAPPARGAGVP